jgi:hypothetical protein
VALAAGVLASLLVAPYLHNSDLCLLVAAGWMVWEEASVFRFPLIAMWLAAAPFLVQLQFGPTLGGWVRIEVAFLAGIVALAVLDPRWRATSAQGGLTGTAELDSHVPA